MIMLKTSVFATGCLLLMVASFPVYSAGVDTPQTALQHYYHSISAGDYRAAYSIFDTPTQTLEQYIAGFADTAHVEPYFGDAFPVPGATDGSVYVPSALVTTKSTGVLELYYGCFVMQQPFASSDAWAIASANFATAPTNIPATPNNLQAALGVNCQTLAVSWAGIGGAYGPAPEVQLINAYYNAINTWQFSTAYALWLQPLPTPDPDGAPPSDYRLPFDSFVLGYSNTRYVTVYAGQFDYQGAAAGKPYLKGFLPVVLVSESVDGSFETFTGCYVIGGLTNGFDNSGIVNGRFNSLGAGLISGSQILNTLATIDCASLGMSM
jgi:hypothetical protein